MNLKNYITDIVDFPRKEIIFKDISPLLADKNALKYATQQMALPFLKDANRIDAVVGIEARGFIIAALLASTLNTGIILCRKTNKLPPPVIETSYQLEYGNDTLQIKKSLKTKNVIIVDDVLATGGTLKATASLCQKADYNILGFSVLIDLTFLHAEKFEIDHQTINTVLKY